MQGAVSARSKSDRRQAPEAQAQAKAELHHCSIRLRRDWYDALTRTARRNGQTVAAMFRSWVVIHCGDEHRAAADPRRPA